jgi:heme/copper-type cytochrome/quinol oxidase subunit 2
MATHDEYMKTRLSALTDKGFQEWLQSPKGKATYRRLLAEKKALERDQAGGKIAPAK